MLWLGGFPALEVTTSTPDALCPPIEEARAAINARVGEVRGDYHVKFALVRAADGHQVLQLAVQAGQEQVLSRELPLDDADCQDAAQTIALVLERYFDAVEKPAVVASEPEPIPVRADEQPTPSSLPSAAHDAATTREPPARTWRARAGFVYDLGLGIAPTLGVAQYPHALRWTPALQLGVALDLAPFLSPLKESAREQEIRAFSLQAGLSIPLVWSFAPWSASLGPWAQLRVQRAEAKSFTHQQPGYRIVPGVGGAAQLAWSPVARWTLGLGVACGAQTATSRFVLQTTDSGPKPVLVPETWFGQGQLTLALEL